MWTVLRILSSILHLHTSNQEASTGWARPKINDTKTPNWFISCLLYHKFEFAGIFILKLKIYPVFRDILSICQLHILLSRTAQISLEVHFCVELHSLKSPGCHSGPKSPRDEVTHKLKLLSCSSLMYFEHLLNASKCTLELYYNSWITSNSNMNLRSWWTGKPSAIPLPAVRRPIGKWLPGYSHHMARAQIIELHKS